MRFSYEFAMEEYKKVKKYLDRYQYRCEVTGSLRRKKEDIGDIDIVVGNQLSLSVRLESKENLKELETEVLEIVSKYSEVERRINHYEFLLKSGISIHMIPEISKHFNYTLWHSTGPKLHVKLIKDIYEEKGMEIDMENKEEKQIYENINLEYMEPEKRWESIEDYQKETEAGIKGEKSYDKKTKSKKNNSCTS